MKFSEFIKKASNPVTINDWVLLLTNTECMEISIPTAIKDRVIEKLLHDNWKPMGKFSNDGGFISVHKDGWEVIIYSIEYPRERKTLWVASSGVIE